MLLENVPDADIIVRIGLHPPVDCVESQFRRCNAVVSTNWPSWYLQQLGTRRVYGPAGNAGFLSCSIYQEFVLSIEKKPIETVYWKFGIPDYIHTLGDQAFIKESSISANKIEGLAAQAVAGHCSRTLVIGRKLYPQYRLFHCAGSDAGKSYGFVSGRNRCSAIIQSKKAGKLWKFRILKRLTGAQSTSGLKTIRNMPVRKQSRNYSI